MRNPLLAAAPCVLAILLCSSAASAEPWDKPGWTVTFHDEFDQGVVAPTSWVKRYKWGESQINGELQAYIDDAFGFDTDKLRIIGKHEQGQYAGKTFDYTSGVISSVHEQRFGYFEISCRMPKGQGLWPAFWLLGKVGAEGVNEIDIHEFLGHEANKIYMTLHWGTDYGAGHKSDGTSWVGADFTADYHTYAVEWETDHVTWFIDGQERFKHTGEGVPQVEMYAIANLAIGGGWPGAPDNTTVFPSYYDVDYIRIYERAPDAGPADAAAEDTGAATDSGGDASVQDTGPAKDGPDVDMGTPKDGGVTEGGGTTNPAAPPTGEDDGGCGCHTAGRNNTGGLAALIAMAGLLLRKRR
jgi:beta-glucanase (GH16 family)